MAKLRRGTACPGMPANSQTHKHKKVPKCSKQGQAHVSNGSPDVTGGNKTISAAVLASTC